MKKDSKIKTEDNPDDPGYQTPEELLRQLRNRSNKNQGFKPQGQGFQKSAATMQQRGKGFRG